MKRRSMFYLAMALIPAVARAAPGPARADRSYQRLEHLRETLREVSAPAPHAADRHLERITREIDGLERAWRAPFDDVSRGELEEYQRARLTARAEHLASSWNLLRDVRRRLTSEATPEELANLREWRESLERDLNHVDPPAPTVDADSDRQARRRAERVELEKQIADLRTDLRYWSEQRSGAGAGGRQRRAEVLRRQIKDEEWGLARGARR